jgi:hypothetical protein
MSNKEILKEIYNELESAGDGWHVWVAFNEELSKDYDFEQPDKTEIGKLFNRMLDLARADERKKMMKR